MMQAAMASVSAVRVGWRGFEGLGWPWEGWWFDGYQWRATSRRPTRGGALAAALDASVAYRERAVAENDDSAGGDAIVRAARTREVRVAGRVVHRPEDAAPESPRLEVGSEISKAKAATQAARIRQGFAGDLDAEHEPRPGIDGA